MQEEENRCSICSEEMIPATKMDFIGIGICQDCHSSLSLDEIGPLKPFDYLAVILDQKGLDILGKVTSLISRTPKETGWKVLGMAPFIGDQVTDPAQRGIMESALIIMGSSMIRSGNDDQENEEITNKLVTLLLVIGQYLDLSVMGDLSSKLGLDQGNRIHEFILVEEHNHRLFSLLREIEHLEDPEKMTIIARAMSMLVR